MENSPEEKYKKLLAEMRCWYKETGKVYAPILREHIHFNASGFRHLIRKGHKLRSLHDRIRRLLPLPFSKEILMNKSIFVTHQCRQKNNKEIVHFWIFTQRTYSKTIRVVVRQFEGGQKHFFSIMNKTKKSPDREML